MSISLKSVYDWYRNTLRHPQFRWWIIGGTLVYLLSPLDISPDFIPIVGQIDDMMILTLLVTETSQMFLEFAKQRKQEGTVNDKTTQASAVDVQAFSVEE